MKVAGFLLLLAGWMLVLSAIALLPAAGSRSAFLLAGLGVEILGLVLGHARASHSRERTETEPDVMPATYPNSRPLCILFPSAGSAGGAGLALINAGLGRSRNAAHAMMAALCVMAVAACVYFVCGRAFQGYAGGLAHSIIVSAQTAGTGLAPNPGSFAACR